MNDEKDSSKSGLISTRVDLGDDLLEKTVFMPSIEQLLSIEKAGKSTQESIKETIDDLLESAKILISEGFIEDGKKVLHQILIRDPGNAVAKESLHSIHGIELKQIFGDAETPRRPYGQKKDAAVEDIDSEAVMRQLDSDLDLGIFSRGTTDPEIQLALFDSPEQLDDYCKKLEESLLGNQAKDWMDLGIGFLEMDLYSVAIRIFAAAARRIDADPQANHEDSIAVTCLLALALILSHRPFEAISKIQPVLGNVEIPTAQKIELFYLMGRTYESLEKLDIARHYFQQIREIDPNYRDIDERLSKKTKQKI